MKKKDKKPASPAMPSKLILSADLVQALLDNLGRQQLAQALPLYQRISAELRGQLVQVTAEPPAK